MLERDALVFYPKMARFRADGLTARQPGVELQGDQSPGGRCQKQRSNRRVHVCRLKDFHENRLPCSRQRYQTTRQRILRTLSACRELTESGFWTKVCAACLWRYLQPPLGRACSSWVPWCWPQFCWWDWWRWRRETGSRLALPPAVIRCCSAPSRPERTVCAVPGSAWNIRNLSNCRRAVRSSSCGRGFGLTAPAAALCLALLPTRNGSTPATAVASWWSARRPGTTINLGRWRKAGLERWLASSFVSRSEKAVASG